MSTIKRNVAKLAEFHSKARPRLDVYEWVGVGSVILVVCMLCVVRL